MAESKTELKELNDRLPTLFNLTTLWSTQPPEELTFHDHTLTIMSCWYPTDTMYLELGENATQATPYLCSWSSATWVLSATSHTRTAGMCPLWRGEEHTQNRKHNS